MGDASSVTLHQLIARVESCDDASQATRYVDAIRLALSQALARRNATTLPGRLPFEILSMIFALLETSDLMHVTAVCRHWRTAGLDDARLWRTIDIQCHTYTSNWGQQITYTSNWGQQISDDFDASYWDRHMQYSPGEDEPHCIRDCAADAVSTNHHLLPLFLKRSKSAMIVLKLDLRLHFSIEIAERIAASLHEHSSHIGSLTIDFGCDLWLRLLLLCPGMLHLSTLGVMRYTDTDDTMELATWGLRGIDRWLRFPALNTLILTGVADSGGLTVPPSPVPTVTCLQLSHFDATAATIAWYLAIFPNIEVLHISSCRGEDDWISQGPIPNRLKRLELYGIGRHSTFLGLLADLGADRIPYISRGEVIWEHRVQQLFSSLGDVKYVGYDVVGRAPYQIDVSAVDTRGFERYTYAEYSMSPVHDGVNLLTIIKPALDIRHITTLKLYSGAWAQLVSITEPFVSLMAIDISFVPNRNSDQGRENELNTWMERCTCQPVARQSFRLRATSLELLRFSGSASGKVACSTYTSSLIAITETLLSVEYSRVHTMEVIGLKLIRDDAAPADTLEHLQSLAETFAQRESRQAADYCI